MHPGHRSPLVLAALLSIVWLGHFFLEGCTRAVNYSAPDLRPHEGKYFRWAAPPGWRVSETNAGITLTSPDGRYSAFLAMLLRSKGSRTPLDFLQWILSHTGCKNVRVLSTENLPDQRISYQVWQFVEVTLSYTERGLPVTGVIRSGVASYYGMNDAMIVGYRAADGDFHHAKSFMPQVARSIILKPKKNPLDNSTVAGMGQNGPEAVDEAMHAGTSSSTIPAPVKPSTP